MSKKHRLQSQYIYFELISVIEENGLASVVAIHEVYLFIRAYQYETIELSIAGVPHVFDSFCISSAVILLKYIAYALDWSIACSIVDLHEPQSS